MCVSEMCSFSELFFIVFVLLRISPMAKVGRHMLNTMGMENNNKSLVHSQPGRMLSLRSQPDRGAFPTKERGKDMQV